MGFVAHLLDWAPLAGTLIQPLLLLLILCGLTLYAATCRGEQGIALLDWRSPSRCRRSRRCWITINFSFGFGCAATLALIVVGLGRRWGSLIGEGALGITAMTAVWIAQV